MNDDSCPHTRKPQSKNECSQCSIDPRYVDRAPPGKAFAPPPRHIKQRRVWN